MPRPGVARMRVMSSITSTGVTPPSSLLRAHAPDLDPPPRCALRSLGWSLQVAVSPCCIEALPDVISADLSLDAWTPTPALPTVRVLVSSCRASAFPPLGPGRQSAIIHTATSVWTPISGLQSFTDVQASRFARHPGRSHRRAPPDAQGGRGFYVRAPHRSLPPRAPDMLAVRIEQLTAWGLSPHQIRSLVGCSPNAGAKLHGG